MATTTTRFGDAANAASDAMNATADFVSDTHERLRDEFGTNERKVRELIETYPLTCFFGAIVVGYLAGRIATRL